MRARVIQMINNFYKDGIDSEITEEENGASLGEYCCLGYFDALHVEKIEWNGRTKWKEMRRQTNHILADKLKGTCNIKNIVCVTDDIKGDDRFWELAEKCPYLFVSMVRTERKNEGGKVIKEIIKEINNSANIMAYYTYDHSEIILTMTSSSFVKGMEFILDIYNKIKVFKMYSIFSVKESELETCEGLKEEEVNCLVSATVKDRTCVDKYIKELEESLQEEGAEDKVNVVYYDTLGNSDILIKIPQMPISRILKCYRMGRILTHTNPTYRATFFNAESQIFLKGVNEDGGKLDKRRP